MSGLVAILRRDGAPVETDEFARMMGSLSHRGLDGCAQDLSGSLALGHQHFWTTPEEVGERQPLVTVDGHTRLIFDGRLDNRDELLSTLDISGDHPSDAALVAGAYDLWDERCTERLRGPFAFVLWDGHRKRLVCARDALGERRLFYYLDARNFMIASEELALLAHPCVPRTLNQASIARLFAVQAPAPGATYYDAIHELRPAHRLVVDRETISTERYWRFDPTGRIRYRTDDEYAEHFRALLDASVGRCLRSSTPPAVLMSGGLDSTSIAALAANRQPERLRTVSWVFDELTDVDERPYIDAVVETSGLESIRFPADGLWPLCNGSQTGWDDNGPVRNPFRELLGHSCQEARRAGSRVVISGSFGDDLYIAAQAWLAELIGEGRLIEAARELTTHLRRYGLHTSFGAAPVRHLLSAGLSRVPGWRALRDRRRRRGVAHLTSHAQELLRADEEADERGLSAQENRARSVLEGRHVFFLGPELCQSHRSGVELRLPYWDRDLVEFMLQIPTHQLYRGAQHKHVQRNAMQGLLPEAVRMRTKGSLLTPLFERGILQRERSMTRMMLEAPDATWRQYVRPDWVTRAMQKGSGHTGLELVIIWHCVASELWGRRKDRPVEFPAGVYARNIFDEGNTMSDHRISRTEPGEDTRAEESKRRAERRPYRSPQLDVLGDVRGLVLGGSPPEPGDSDTGFLAHT